MFDVYCIPWREWKGKASQRSFFLTLSPPSLTSTQRDEDAACIYRQVVAVECLEDSFGVPSRTIGRVFDIDEVDTSDFTLGFPPLPTALTPSMLTDVSSNPSIVLGPLVSPTIESAPFLPVSADNEICDGLPCPTVCDVPGQQLGALVGISETFTCEGPSNCTSPTIGFIQGELLVTKAINVEGITVGSSAFIQFQQNFAVASVPSGASVTLKGYIYTTVFFQYVGSVDYHCFC